MAIKFDNVRILAHFRIPALTERDMARAGYDFQSPDNEKPRLERGTEPCPRKSYSSTRPCSRASSTPWCERRSSGSSTRCSTPRRTRSPTPRDTVFLQIGVHSMRTIFQQYRRLVSSGNCVVGIRRPFFLGCLVMRACSLR